MALPVTLLDQVTEIKKTDISYRILHSKALLTNASTGETIEIPFNPLLRKYRDFLGAIIVSVDLETEDELRYRYKPKTLSQDIYGTTELWDELISINGCASVMEFVPKKVLRVYDPEKIKSVLNEIMILEELF